MGSRKQEQPHQTSQERCKLEAQCDQDAAPKELESKEQFAQVLALEQLKIHNAISCRCGDLDQTRTG